MYIRVCEGLKDKGKLIPVNSDIFSHINPERDYYASVFEYNEAQKKTFEEKGTIAGIADVSTHKLYFDFDSANFEEARKDSLEMVKRLKLKGIKDSDIRVYFSGSKGAHVIVNTQERITPHQMRQVAIKLATGLKTLDTSVYNASRILRITGTKHGKSGLYKTLLTHDELAKLPVEDIKKLASEPYAEDPAVRVSLPRTIQDMMKIEVKKDEVTIKSNDVDMTKNPLNLTPWKLALFHGYFPAGNRSNAMMILAATLKAKGLDRDTTTAMLKVTAEKQAIRFGQDTFDSNELETNIIEQVYGPHWLGKTYSEESFPLALQEYLVNMGFNRASANKTKVFESTGDVFSTFDSFAKNIDANTIKTGIDQLDKAVTMTTSMLVGVLGAPSSFKTGFSMNVLELLSKSNEKAAFFSMDMSSPLVYQRMIQKCTGYGSNKIKEIFKENKEEDIKKIKYMVDQSYKNIDFCFKTALTVDNIKEAIIQRQEETGVKYRLVVVDYLECLSADISDSTQRAAYLAQALKDIANELGICVMLLLQPTKVSGTPRDPLDSYAKIRGSGNISAACSIILSIWREGFSPRTADQDKFITFGVLKNRMGQLAQIDMGFDGGGGLIYELDETEKQELEELRALNRQERNSGDRSF